MYCFHYCYPILIVGPGLPQICLVCPQRLQKCHWILWWVRFKVIFCTLRHILRRSLLHLVHCSRDHICHFPPASLRSAENLLTSQEKAYSLVGFLKPLTQMDWNYRKALLFTDYGNSRGNTCLYLLLSPFCGWKHTIFGCLCSEYWKIRKPFQFIENSCHPHGNF